MSGAAGEREREVSTISPSAGHHHHLLNIDFFAPLVTAEINLRFFNPTSQSKFLPVFRLQLAHNVPVLPIALRDRPPYNYA
jgi:hypothetical protein